MAGEETCMFFIGFPLLLVPFAIYNIFLFLMTGFDFKAPLFSISMLSGARWDVSSADLLLLLATILLFVEILKATRFGMRSIVDHMLSLILFIAMLLEFIMVAGAATSTFFILLMITLVDVCAGFSVSIRTAQRDLSVEGSGHIPAA
jgi:hypothetical protein